MVIRGEFRTHASTVVKEGEMTHIEHFRGIIGIIQDGLIVLSAKQWGMEKIMGIIAMEIGICQIVKGFTH